MVRRLLMLSIIALCLGLVGMVYAETVAVYAGTADAKQLSGWGSGKLTVDKAVKCEGTPALNVETKGYYEGGYLTLPTPVDLAPYTKAAQQSAVVVKLKFGASKSTTPAGGGGGRGGFPGLPGGGGFPGGGGGFPGGMPAMPAAPGGMPAMPGFPGADAGPAAGPLAVAQATSDPSRFAQLPGLPGEGAGMPAMPGIPGGAPAMPAMPGGFGAPGGFPGGGMPVMGPGIGAPGTDVSPFGAMPMATVPTTPPKPLEMARVVLITDKGQLDLGALAFKALKKQGDWGEARVAFSDLKGPGGAEGAKLQGVVFTGNSGGSFFVGRLELVGG